MIEEDASAPAEVSEVEVQETAPRLPFAPPPAAFRCWYHGLPDVRRSPAVLFVVPREWSDDFDIDLMWPEGLPDYLPHVLVRRVMHELAWAVRCPSMASPVEREEGEGEEEEESKSDDPSDESNPTTPTTPSLLPDAARRAAVEKRLADLLQQPVEDRTADDIARLVYTALVPGEGGGGAAGGCAGSAEDREQQGTGTAAAPEFLDAPPPSGDNDRAAQQLVKLLPDLRHLGTPQLPANLDPQRLQKLADEIERSPKLQRLLELVGRLSAAGWMASRTRSRARENVVGVTLGGDLTRVVTSELMRFGVPGLDRFAYLDYVSGRLLIRETEGDEPRARGPILVALDTSPSMGIDAWDGWKRHDIAHALGLGLVRIASIQKRPVSLVAFAGGITFRADAKTLEQQLLLQEALLRGLAEGDDTSFSEPFEALLAKEREHGFRGGDLVFLTDGQGHLRDDVRALVMKRRKEGLRVFALTIGGGQDEVLPEISDRVVEVRSDEDLSEVTTEISRSTAESTDT